MRKGEGYHTGILNIVRDIIKDAGRGGANNSSSGMVEEVEEEAW